MGFGRHHPAVSLLLAGEHTNQCVSKLKKQCMFFLFKKTKTVYYDTTQVVAPSLIK